MILLFLSISFSDIVDDIGDFWSGLNNVKESGFEILVFDVSASSAAIGGQYGEKGIQALHINPAGIMKEKEDSYSATLLTSHRTLSCGMRSEYMSYIMPAGSGYMGFVLQGFFTGDMELRDDVPGDPLGTYSMENIIGGLTYARKVKNIDLGITVRYLHERIFSSAYSTYSFDLGISYPLMEYSNGLLRFDLSFTHLGPKYHSEYEFRLPTTWHIGIMSKISDFRGGISLHKPLNTEIQFLLGGQYEIGNITLRAGKKMNNPLEEYSIGFGVKKSRFKIDYSFSPTSTDNVLDSSHLFTLSIGI